MTAEAGFSPSRLSGRSIARWRGPRGDAVVRRARFRILRRSEAEAFMYGDSRRVVAVVADVEAVVVMAGRRGRLSSSSWEWPW